MCNAPMEGVKRMWRGGEARPKAPSKVKTAFGRSRRADARCKTCSGAPEVLLRHEKRVRERPMSCCAMKNVFGRARTAIATLQQLF